MGHYSVLESRLLPNRGVGLIGGPIGGSVGLSVCRSSKGVGSGGDGELETRGRGVIDVFRHSRAVYGLVYGFSRTARLESVRKKLTLLTSINVALGILATSEPFRRFDRPIMKRSRGCEDEVGLEFFLHN
jgi:hypothetical protein